MATAEVPVEILARNGKRFLVHQREDYQLLNPTTHFQGALGTVMKAVNSPFRPPDALNMLFGYRDEGARVAGEFILQSKLTPIASLMMEGYACCPATLRDEILATQRTIAFAKADYEQILELLNSHPDGEDGTLGPRGSVLVYGRLKLIGTFPARRACIVPDQWMVLHNKNNLNQMADEWGALAKGAASVVGAIVPLLTMGQAGRF